VKAAAERLLATARAGLAAAKEGAVTAAEEREAIVKLVVDSLDRANKAATATAKQERERERERERARASKL
jgi:hypothetical protein